jgi:hypothetical protein
VILQRVNVDARPGKSGISTTAYDYLYGPEIQAARILGRPCKVEIFPTLCSLSFFDALVTQRMRTTLHIP